MRERERGAGSQRAQWLYLNVSLGALAGRFNIPPSPSVGKLLRGAFPTSLVFEDDGSNPILLNKRRKPIIDGAEKVHRKPIRRSSSAPLRARRGSVHRRRVDATATTSEMSTTNVCFPPAPLVGLMVGRGLLMGERYPLVERTD